MPWPTRSTVMSIGVDEGLDSFQDVVLGLGWPGPWVPASLRGGPQGSAEGIVDST